MCVSRPLQLRQTQQKSLQQKEEILFRSIAEDDLNKARTVAKELKNIIKPLAEVRTLINTINLSDNGMPYILAIYVPTMYIPCIQTVR